MRKLPGLGRIRRLWIIGLAAAGLVFIGYTLTSQSVTIGPLRVARPGMLWTGLVVHLLFWMLVTHFWSRVVFIVAGVRIPYRDSFFQLALVAVGKYLPGKIWGFVARGAALRREKMAAADIIAASVLEQWIMLMSAVLWVGLLLPILHGHDLGFLLAFFAITLTLVSRYLYRYGAQALQTLLARVQNSAPLNLVSTPGVVDYWTLIGIHSLMWVLATGVLVAVCAGFSIHPLSGNFLVALMLANTLGIVVGFAALFAPGGIGVREAVTTFVLLPYLPLERAVALSVLLRLWSVAGDALLAMALVISSFRARH